jgi:anti-sigma regulatory factor (Ser/Thr protein kinase)
VTWVFESDDPVAARHARGAFRAYLQDWGTPESDYAAAEVIFGELIANVIEHAPGPIKVLVAWEEGVAVLRVEDHGPGCDAQPALPSNPFSEPGRGLFLAGALARRLTMKSVPGGGTHVCAALPVGRRRERPPEAPTR